MGCRISAQPEYSKYVDSQGMHRFFRKQKKSSQQEVEAVPKLEISLRSAVLIQRWYRRYLARIEVRQRYTWKIFQSIEYAGELDQMKLYNFFNALLSHIDPNKEDNDLQRRCSVTSYSGDANEACSPADPLLKTDPSKVRIDSAYKGPRLNDPLTKTDLLTLIEGYKNRKTLHIRYVYMIVHEAIKILSKMPSISRSSTAMTGQVTICGDLHGKLDDLLIIFHKNGLPSKDNPYVFNGDFIDRGKHSIEVLMILLLCMILNPSVVHLNRGNHEDPMMNARYGFTREIMVKYKNHASTLLALLGQLFAWLPLGTLVDNKAFVVHGGISSETDLQWLQNVERQYFVSLLKSPNISADDEHQNLKLTYLWKQILDLLWSDPRNAPGCSMNAFRGGGCYFGPDITKIVLKRNGLNMLIRSHECKTDGYEYTHDGMCLTIFSASNYYGPGSNRGAYVILQGKELKPHFVQFSAQTKIKYINMNERVGALEKSAMQELRTKILLHKSLLISQFRKLDKDGKGLVDVNDWIRVMDQHCCSHIPWRILREKIVALDTATGAVPYEETFQMNVANDTENQQTVVETLYSNRDRLETIFRTLDKDNSGFLSLDEVADACTLLKDYLSEPIPYDEMVNLARSMDINKDGYIDFNEFLESFRLVDIDHAQEQEVQ